VPKDILESSNNSLSKSMSSVKKAQVHGVKSSRAEKASFEKVIHTLEKEKEAYQTPRTHSKICAVSHF
jgi:hypothetical protein